MRGPGRPSANYRYIIAVDSAEARCETIGYRRRGDAQLAFAGRISEARRKFGMPNDVLPRTDTRSDRRVAVLHATKVGPEIITLRRINASDIDITPGSVRSSEMGAAGKIITALLTIAFWGSLIAYGAIEYGYKSAIEFAAVILGFMGIMIMGAITTGLVAGCISSLRNLLMRTERGRRVEYVLRRGLFYSYVTLVTPVIVLMYIFVALGVLGLIAVIGNMPLQILTAFVAGIEWLGHSIGIW